MGDFIKNNYQWLFDGLGLFVISAVSSLIYWLYNKGILKKRHAVIVIPLLLVLLVFATYFMFTSFWEDRIEMNYFKIFIIVVIASVVAGVLSFGIVRTELKLLREEFNKLVAKDNFTDDLTEMPNVKALVPKLLTSITLAKDQNTPLSVLLIDVDNLGFINDEYDFESGDLVLKAVTLKLKQNIRGDGDSIIRYKIGDEFLVIASKTTGRNAAEKFAERLRELIYNEVFFLPKHNKSVRMTISIGVTEVDLSNDTYQSVLQRVEMALGEAKKRKNAVFLAQENKN